MENKKTNNENIKHPHSSYRPTIRSYSKLLSTLATKNDKIWPMEKWPAMRFKEGLKVGSNGGHGPIKYSVKRLLENELVEFQFQEPKGFKGIHKLEMKSVEDGKTELKHTIDMQTNFLGTLQWHTFVRVLHNALIEDAFDKIENQFSSNKKETGWNFWVKGLRMVLK